MGNTTEYTVHHLYMVILQTIQYITCIWSYYRIYSTSLVYGNTTDYTVHHLYIVILQTIQYITCIW